MADVEAVDGRYVMRASIMVEAPVEQVRAVLADDARLVEWIPHASWGAGLRRPGQVRLAIGEHIGPTTYVGQTTVEPGGDVVRRWVLAGSTSGWGREVRFTTTRVQGGTLVHAEAVTTIPGAARRALRAGGRAEARGVDDAVARLARVLEGRRLPGPTTRSAGPL